MEEKNVVLERSGSIATIKFNRPKLFNAYSVPLGMDLIDVLETCYYDDDVRAVILTGEGKAFCAGGDISGFKNYLDTDPAKPVRDLIVPFNKCISLIRRMPKPVIGAINGVASGAGIVFVSACDFRVAASSAKFKQAYVSIGLSGDGALWLLLPQLIGFARATEMAFFDPLIDAKTALEWGLVNKVVEDGKLMEESMAVAKRALSIATKGCGLAKQSLTHGMMSVLDSQFQFEQECMAKAAETKDYIEGIKAFLERRKPDFKGR